MIAFFRLFANNMAVITLVCAVIAYFFPPVFLIFGSVFQWLFAATMFALGIVLDKDELRYTLRDPQSISLGILTQYTIMPLCGFLVAKLAGLPDAVALGFIIVGSAPGAMASNVIVYLAGGVLAFSIAMTVVATMLSPLITPAIVEGFGGQYMEIPFLGMMWTILKTVVIPILLGMWLQRYLGKTQAFFKEAAPFIAALAIVIICAFAVAKNQQNIANTGLEIFALVVLVNAAGYALGWLFGKLYRFDHRKRITLSIEIGMQNAGLGAVLALKHFQDMPETALPSALFAFWSVITAAMLSAFMRRKGVAGAI